MSVALPEPKKRPDLLIIAGEHSGDEHAAVMLRELLSAHRNLTVCALGGPELEKAGAQLLMDLTASSVVGLFEVLKNYSFFRKLFNETIAWIEKYKPKAICFVDYPGFNLRLAKRLYEKRLCHKAGGPIKLHYYISPQIWAWNSKRRFSMAKWLDGLGCILPFEVDCYRDTNLDVQFLGHPFLSKDYQNPVSYDAAGSILLLPGSRTTAVGRIFPVMLDAFELILEKYPKEKGLVVYPSEKIFKISKNILKKRNHLKEKVIFQHNEQKFSGKALIGSSGTMSLACALAGIPGTVLYKANPLTYLIGRMLVNINYLGIANILLNKAVYPEYIQHKATGEALAQEIIECITLGARRESIVQDAEKLKSLLVRKDEAGPGFWLGSCLVSGE